MELRHDETAQQECILVSDVTLGKAREEDLARIVSGETKPERNRRYENGDLLRVDFLPPLPKE